MGDHRIDAHAVSPAPPERVWALLADATTWPRWSDFEEAMIEQSGPDDPQGVGCVRRFKFGPTRTRERIVAFDPPCHVAYVLLAGLPLRDYRGEVLLAPTEAGGTEINWQSRFGRKVPGTGRLFRKRLGGFIQDLADALGAEAAAE